MCDQHSSGEVLSDQFIRSIRYPKEKKFYTIACITILLLWFGFVGTFFREEIHDVLQENIITDDKNSLSESKKMPLPHSIIKKFPKKSRTMTRKFWIL